VWEASEFFWDMRSSARMATQNEIEKDSAERGASCALNDIIYELFNAGDVAVKED
jgi:hypothetical protein